jgi:polar amino acid transport system permease protein
MIAMSFGAMLQYSPAVLHGLLMTILCWALASVGALVLGLFVAIGRNSRLPFLRYGMIAYIEALRGTPLIVQIFIVYAGGPSIGIFLEPLVAGVLVLAIHGSAYFAEIYRGGLAAVPRGHIEAAVSLGMTPLDILRRVIIPEALAAIIPSLVNMLINLCKETAVLSIITVADLTFEVQKIAVETFAAFESIFALALCYWIMIETLSRLGSLAEQRFTRHHVHAGS